MKRTATIKNIITTAVAVITMAFIGASSVLASGIDESTYETRSNANNLDSVIGHPQNKKENLKTGETFLNSDGNLEQVIRINADGSFITEEINKSSTQKRQLRCSHPAASLEAIADLLPDTKTVGTSSCCFKYRSVTKCRCKKCGHTLKTYGAWHSHKKHKYPLFGKTCKSCGYRKK